MSSIVLRPVGDGDAITVTGDAVIGRNDACNIVLKAGTVSGKHARLSLKNDVLWVEDLGSTNGTFVNGQRVVQPMQIKNGDRVRFDVLEFELMLPMAPPGATQIRSGTIVQASLKDAGADLANQRAAVARGNEPAPPAAPRETAPPAAVPTAAPSAAPAAPTPGAVPPSSPAQEPAARKPNEQAVKPDSAAPRKPPGAWADPSNRQKGKTAFISDEELKNVLGEAVAPEAGPELDVPHLLVRAGNSKGKCLLLQTAADESVWKVGSDSREATIVFDDAGVSSLHALLESKAGRWKVIDQMSANGTYVNNVKVTVRYLESGDRLKFGPVECVLRVPEAKGARRLRRYRPFWLFLLASFVATALALFLLFR